MRMNSKSLSLLERMIFFFQAEDGIRDGHVTGVQTCALPIYFQITQVREDFQASVSEVLMASVDPQGNALVEALGPDWHFGEALNYNRRGHIPHAKMVPYFEFYNEDKTFKSPEELRQLLGLVGVSDEQSIYTHCGGGIAGSVAFFAVKFLA